MPFRYANVRYRTDPERLARVLPPGLEPAAEPEVLVDVLEIDFGPAKSVFFAFPYDECAMWLRATYEGEDGFFLLSMPLNGDWGRTAGRETLALSKKDADVAIRHEAGTVSASFQRRGSDVCTLDARVGAGPAPEVD